MVVVLLLCALALIGNYILWIENIRHGFRSRCYSMPVRCLLFFLCHDLTFVASYRLWFRDIDHWFPRLWWFGLILTVIMELTFLGMFFTFGRKELAPKVSQRAFVAATLVGLAFTSVGWAVTWIALGIAAFLGGLINLGYVHHLNKHAEGAQRGSEAQNPEVAVG